MQMPSLTSLFSPQPALITSKPSREDAHDIAKSVSTYCKQIGCTESNTVAAIAWAFDTPGSDTLAAVRSGKCRARQLLARQPQPPRTPVVA